MINIHLDSLLESSEQIKIDYVAGRGFQARLFSNGQFVCRGDGQTIIDAILDLTNELLNETLDSIREKVR